VRSGTAVGADGTVRTVGLDLRVGWKVVGLTRLGSEATSHLDWRPRKVERQRLMKHDDDACLLKMHDLHEWQQYLQHHHRHHRPWDHRLKNCRLWRDHLGDCW
jgi:hypothetical protein